MTRILPAIATLFPVLAAHALQAAETTAAAAPESNPTHLLVALGLLALALVFLVAEFFIPSGGLLGLLTLLCAVGSVISMFLWSQLAGLILMATLLVLGPVIVIQGVKVWSKTPIGKRAVLHGEAGGGPVHDALAPEASPQDGPTSAGSVTVGARGIAETPLRPGGFVRFGRVRVDAVAEGRFIDAGEHVEVLGRVEAQWRVRRVEGD